jgi:hypothetical protein
VSSSDRVPATMAHLQLVPPLWTVAYHAIHLSSNLVNGIFLIDKLKFSELE